MQPDTFEVRAIEGCFPVGVGIDESAESIEAVIEELGIGEFAAQQLRGSLSNAIEFLRLNGAESKQSWVYIRDGSSGRVDAVVTMEFFSVGEEDKEKYVAAFRGSDQPPGAEVINRRVQLAELPNGEAVVVHDFLLDDSESNPAVPALERAIVGVFSRERAPMVEFTVLTQDLALFEDITEFAVMMAGTVQFSTEMRP